LKRLVSITANFTGLKSGVNKRRGEKNCMRAQNFARSLQMTEPALDLVIAALERIRDSTDRAPCASKTVLAQLRTVSVAISLSATPKSNEGARETSASPTGRRLQALPSKAALLEPIRERVRACTKCAHLACSRTQTVFGVGNPDADLMFIGEAPGVDEDQQGEPFVGRAGQLLTKIIKAMNFAREDVYIANILKCRPDMPSGSFGNRAPTPVEMQTCRPYLIEQIDVIQPKVLVALGAVAVEGLLGMRGTMRELRGRWHAYNSIPLMITYHPAYLLRNQAPSEKRKVWEDMLQVLERLEQPITERQRNYFL
jgi:DNA polymerase